MIEGFEKYTEELSEYEIQLLPVFVTCLERHIGRKLAITNQKICEGLLHCGYTPITSARIRKIINAIRMMGLIPRLVASSDGYYVCETEEELKNYIRSLKARANAINDVALSLMHFNKLNDYDLTNN